MLKYILLIAAVCWLSACSTRMRPMYIPCKASKADFISTATTLLKANNYKIIELNADMALLEATRNPIQQSLGENLEISGPYLFRAAYKGDTISVNVATYFREAGRNKTFQTHDDSRNTNQTDQVNFMPVVNGLRNLCRTQ